jgi:hypothetical protein
MKNKKIVSMLMLGVLAIAVAFGAVGYRSASAQTGTPTVQTGTTSSTSTRLDKGMPGGMDSEYLATALGITVDELTAANQKANAAALAQAVEQGLITQAQADQFTANGDGMAFGGRGRGWLNQGTIDMDALLAEALGIPVEKLQAAQLEARNAQIDQAVADGQMTQEQADLMKGRNALAANADFQASMKTAYETAVAQAVSAGVITQAQADLILADNSAKGFGMGFAGFDGGGHGHGGHGGRGGFDLNDAAAPQAPGAPTNDAAAPQAPTATP